MPAFPVPRDEWESFLDRFNRHHAGERVRVQRHQPGAGVIFEVVDCIFHRIHDDQSGERHRIGVMVDEPQASQETYFMTDPRQLLWHETDVTYTLQIEGADGRCLIVQLLQKTEAAA